MKFDRISGFAVAVTVICALFVTSCDNSEPAVVAEVSSQYSEVSSAKGSMFVYVTCGGDWTLSLQEDVDWASLSKTSGSGNSRTVQLQYQANTTEADRSLTIRIDCGTQWSTCQVTQLAAGKRPDGDDGQDAPQDMDLTKVAWLELPALDNPNLDYYAHWFTYNGTRYRNYSFGYSKKDYVSIWVAYPLCENPYLTGSSSGEGDDWAPNPLFDAALQPDYSRSFGFSSGYERGHQIANADRKCSSEANRQTYYFTNSTLQHKNFNGPVWGVLENNMREAAKTADTLYVVTGCVIPDSPSYIRDSYDHNVPIPSGYFKAALRFHKASTHAVWLGAAFYLEHDASKYPSKLITSSESMSIAELEKKLGIDFFVNLPDEIGADHAAAVESQNPDNYSSIWGIR